MNNLLKIWPHTLSPTPLPDPDAHANTQVPIAFVNNLLKYGLNEIALCFRSRLTKHYYKVALLRKCRALLQKCRTLFTNLLKHGLNEIAM